MSVILSDNEAVATETLYFKEYNLLSMLAYNSLGRNQ